MVFYGMFRQRGSKALALVGLGSVPVRKVTSGVDMGVADGWMNRCTYNSNGFQGFTGLFL